ncbi:MAG TPA: hypothetical protein PLF81_13690, partial [Candidatus Anammoximicrobium sp.]|nr:hypothetical protein [Candidatus Anammoximicrobium sp.]
AIAAGLLFVAAGVFLAVQIKIRIRDMEGKETVIAPPPGAEVVVEQDGKEVFKLPLEPAPTQPQPAQLETTKPESERKPKPLKIGPPVPRPKPIEIDLKPEPLDLQPGAPMSRMALVSNPAPIPGVRSWTIETIGHRGFYEYLAFSPDGDTMATCCLDDVIRLWDAKTGRFLRGIVGHNGPIQQVCWSPNGKFMASASFDGTVRLWDANTGTRLSTFLGDNGFSSIAWSPDGRFLAAGRTGYGPIHLWEFLVGGEAGHVAEPRAGWRLMGPGIRNRVLEASPAFQSRTLAWSPDGTRLAFDTAESGHRAFLYNVHSNTLACLNVGKRLADALKAKTIQAGAVRESKGVAWSPDGRTLAFGERPVLLLDAELHEIDAQIEESGPTSWVYSLAWSPSGRRLAFCSALSFTTVATVWDFERMGELCGPVKRRQLVGPPDRHRESVPLVYSPDGKTLGVGHILCEAESGVPRHALPAHKLDYHTKSAWSQDGRLLAAPVAPFVQVWDAGTGRLVHEIESYPDYNALAWSSAATLAVGCRGGIRIWDSRDPQRLPGTAFGYGKPQGLSWSPDLKLLVVDAGFGMLTLYDVLSRKEMRNLGKTGRNRAFGYAGSGEAMAFAEDNDVKICDLRTLEVEPPLASLPALVCGLSWSPDGKTIAAACDDRQVYLIDVGSKKVIATCVGHEKPASSFGWTEDGKTLVTGCVSYQGEAGVCVWDAKSGKLLRTIPDGGEVSPDGQLVAWRGQSVIRLRETEKGQVVCTMLSLRNSQYAAISPDGHFRGSPDVEQELVYVVQTDQGQDTLTPAEFAQKYNWKNDPSKVGLKLESSPAAGPQPPLAKPAPVPTPAAADQPQPAESRP